MGKKKQVMQNVFFLISMYKSSINFKNGLDWMSCLRTEQTNSVKMGEEWVKLEEEKG